jgi:8-oxo-dGTP pyrophosphatase MutT (NUDIX family)
VKREVGQAVHGTVVDVFVVSPHRATWRVLTLQRTQTTRCPGAWETVHGKVGPDETPHAAAVRELKEETGLVPARLYNVTAHGFYLHRAARVEVAVAFCAFVDGTPPVKLGEEHVRAEWLQRAAAMKRFAWPSERDCLARAWELLRRGHAGELEDVLRVV